MMRVRNGNGGVLMRQERKARNLLKERNEEVRKRKVNKEKTKGSKKTSEKWIKKETKKVVGTRKKH